MYSKRLPICSNVIVSLRKVFVLSDWVSEVNELPLAKSGENGMRRCFTRRKRDERER